jgi:zinc protease
MTVMNQILGGSGARLFTNVRTKKGLAYSVYSYSALNHKSGAFTAYAGTKNSTVPQAIKELFNQMNIIRDEEVETEELERAQNSLINSFVFEFETPMSVLKERIVRDYLGYPTDFIEKYSENISSVDIEKVQKNAQKWLHPKNAMIFAVGEEDKFSEPLNQFGKVEKVKAD